MVGVANKEGHNPYFNRWISAILKDKQDLIPRWGHNPYFSRWFSAIGYNNSSILDLILTSQSLF